MSLLFLLLLLYLNVFLLLLQFSSTPRRRCRCRRISMEFPVYSHFVHSTHKLSTSNPDSMSTLLYPSDASPWLPKRFASHHDKYFILDFASWIDVSFWVSVSLSISRVCVCVSSNCTCTVAFDQPKSIFKPLCQSQLKFLHCKIRGRKIRSK